MEILPYEYYGFSAKQVGVIIAKIGYKIYGKNCKIHTPCARAGSGVKKKSHPG